MNARRRLTRGFRSIATRRGLIVVAFMLVAVAVAHPWVLHAVAGGLVRDDSVGRAEFAVVLGGDRRHDWVADRYAEGDVGRVLLIPDAPRRLYEFGVLPYPHEQGRAELIRRGVDADDFVLLDTPVRDWWETADALDRWLAERPGVRVACVADRLNSGTVDAVFREVMAPEVYERVAIHGLRDRRYDERDWWRSRQGVKSFYGAAFGWVNARVFGRPEYYFEDDWDVDAYERELVLERTTGDTGDTGAGTGGVRGHKTSQKDKKDRP